MAGKSAREAIDSVAQAFTACGRPDPRLDTAGRIHRDITHQTRGYTKSDPPTKRQAALTPHVYRHLHRHAKTSLDRHIACLISGAFFFAMLSCKYSRVY
eukprot:4666608-Ditylum_brightwellii.AAC.1